MRLMVVLVLQILLIKIFPCKTENRLVSASIILRHGERTIINRYPNDPYSSRYYWPEGYGQLTNKGKLQLFELGQWFRKRYSDFLSDYYLMDDVHVLSSDFNRSIMSAETFLAGLFPPVNNQVWNPNLMWQPIPVHTVSLELDNVFLNHKFCPKFNDLLQQFKNSPEFLKMQENNQNLYDYLTLHMGDLVKEPSQAVFLYDTLEIENDNGYTLPNWTKSVFPSKLKGLLDFILTKPTSTPELTRLQVGPLFDKIASQFDNTNKSQKFTVYSGHDMTLVSILNPLGLYEHERPPYGAAIIFELYRGDGYFVNVLYKEGSILRKLKLHHCELDCPLDKFRKIIQPLRLESHDWDRECFETEYFELPEFLGITILVSFLVGVLLTIAFECCRKRRNKKRKHYMVLMDQDVQEGLK